MEKGTRVGVIGGRKAKGVTGTVFWVGEGRYEQGQKRLGIHGDDGETYWVSAEHVQETNAAPPPRDEPELAKGDVVRFELEGELVEGEVFWVGPSRQGQGLRVGVKDPAGEAHWLDAHQVQRAAAEPEWDDDDPPF